MTTKELGDLGELKALQYLRKKRLQIIETNYRFHRNEVDIIYKLPGKVVFVEVKTRQTAEIGPPWKSVTRHKQKQIIKCAHNYIVTRDLDVEAQSLRSEEHTSELQSRPHLVCRLLLEKKKKKKQKTKTQKKKKNEKKKSTARDK